MDLKTKIIVVLILFVAIAGGASVYFLTSKNKTLNKNECPKGYVYHKDDICITEKELKDEKLVCDDGILNLDKKECVIKEEKEITYTCDKEASLNKDKCLTTTTKMATVTATCPAGSVNIMLTEFCGKDPKSAGFIEKPCPAGTIFQKIYAGGVKYCYKSKRTYNGTHDNCGSNRESYLDTANAICYYDGVKSETTPSCNHLSGTHLYENKCYVTVEKIMDYKCPEGYTKDNNKCYLYNKVDANKTCPKDFILKGLSCVKETVSKPKEVTDCKGDNLLLIKDKCYGVVTIKK